MQNHEPEDPYDPQWEQWFKSNSPKADTPLTEAIEYWVKYESLYGTPHDSNVRSLMRTFFRCRDEIMRQTEIIITLRQELKEAKARNTMYLSRIQEYEVREQ